MNIYEKIDCVITAPHCIAKRLPFVHIATDCIQNQQDSSMTWFPQILDFFYKSYAQQARYWKPPIATHPTSALTMLERIEWSVFQIMTRNHQRRPLFGHRKAEIWATWPKIDKFLKTHLTNVYTIYELNWDSIQNNDRTLPIVIIASFKWAEYWPKRQKPCFLPQALFFCKFDEISVKILGDRQKDMDCL